MFINDPAMSRENKREKMSDETQTQTDAAPTTVIPEQEYVPFTVTVLPGGRHRHQYKVCPYTGEVLEAPHYVLLQRD